MPGAGGLQSAGRRQVARMTRLANTDTMGLVGAVARGAGRGSETRLDSTDSTDRSDFLGKLLQGKHKQLAGWFTMARGVKAAAHLP